MKKLLAYLSVLILPLPVLSLSFGDANTSSIYYRINDSLISRAYIATNATVTCMMKQYPDPNTLPPPDENTCRTRNLKTSPFFMVIRPDGCVKLTYFVQGNPRLLAGNSVLSCPQVNTITGKIISFAKLTTYTDIGGNHESNAGDIPLLFGQPVNFAQAIALLGTDLSGSVFVNAAMLNKKAAALQALYEQYLNSIGDDETPSTQTAYIST